MKKITLETPLIIYERQNEMPEEYQQLMSTARKALEDAYAPYSHFYVGAAALLQDGSIVTGANQENAAYPMCLCAERVALGTASMQHPNIPIKVMAITVKNPAKEIIQPAAPCGSCRQAICEMENRQQQAIILLLQGEQGPIYEISSGASILPLNFNGEYL